MSDCADAAAHTVDPNSVPIPAVRPIANAPQNVTRAAPRATLEPPARAAKAPSNQRKAREDPATSGIKWAGGANAVINSGIAAPTAKLAADANAA